ncbi:hypothetical protein VTO58DRAFT_110971 [Aureobasidium pullulans]
MHRIQLFSRIADPADSTWYKNRALVKNQNTE